MANAAASPGEPTFFLHHANLDRLWWNWQKANLSSRLIDMSGQNVAPLSDREDNHWAYPSAALLDYDGDNGGNVTLLTHNLWFVDMMQNYTVADAMDLNNELNCAEYVDDGWSEGTAGAL
jgi:tyrosinase